ncbi:histidinol-phosphate transaminase [Batrachochytrium salamandrivorans]|nr:histidinol-phosphate transaminase [Batrachochytrium salamandrivorans]
MTARPDFVLKDVVRPNIYALKPYRCARDDYTTGILLDANENSFGPSLASAHGDFKAPTTSGMLTNSDIHLERYPDPHQNGIKELLSSLRGLPSKEYFFLGVGSDESIDIAMRVFCRPGVDKILICPPTYGMYSVSAQVNDVQVVSVPLNVTGGAFQLQVDKILEELANDPTIKIVILCSPGNPTGTLLNHQDIRRVLDFTPFKGVVLVDEAYIDFCGASDGSNANSVATWAIQYPNLIVTQTLSKAFGLAGIRLGFSISSPEIARIFNSTKAPYNISTPTSLLGRAALSEAGQNTMRRHIALIIKERQDLLLKLATIPRVGQSLGGNDSNFVLVPILNSSHVPDNDVAYMVYKTLAETEGVVVRSDNADSFDQIPYIIKQIFQTGREDAFGEQLSHYCARKEGEIERICNLHYQEFVQSVDQLLKVRAGTATMRDKIKAMNDDMQLSGSKIIEKKSELIENRRILLNIETSLETMQSCLFVLDITNRVSIQVNNQKYYSALRMLDELKSTHLALVSQYSFAAQISDWIPYMQNAIREAVVDEMSKWFINVKETTATVGRLAMNLTAMRQDRASEILTSSKHTSKLARNLNVGTSMELAINEEYDMDALDNEDVHIDFTALFQCIHIHEVLGKRTQFKAEYEDNRRLQSEIIIGTVFSLKNGDLSGFERYIQQISGFFVIEATVISATTDFRSRASVEALWEMAVSKMNTHISECLRDCENPELFLEVKMCVVAFIQTMEVYGFAVASVMDLMISLVDRFASVKKSQCCKKLLRVIEEEDDYMPMIINNMEELDQVNQAFKLPTDFFKTTTKLTFPKILPFSKGFQKCCQYIKNFISDYYRFADGFSQQSYEMDDLLKKSLENLLVQNLNGSLLRKIEGTSLSLVIQVMINAQWFEKACGQFEEVLQDQWSAYNGVRVVLQVSQTFEDTRLVAEKRLFEIINSKIDGFLEVSDYNWEATTANNLASVYLTDLVDYLTTVVSSTLALLPSATKAYVYFKAFDHLTSSLKGLLLDPKLKRVTIAMLHTLDIDVAYLETFIKKLNDTSAGDAFTELRQLINYGKSESYEDILVPAIRIKKFSRVDMNDAILILEKLKNFDTSYFSKATSAEKQLKKDIENALRLMRK